MTGLTETEHVVNALDSGGVDYLTKPINIDELRARIRVHLSNARSAQSARVALDAAGRHLLAVKASGAIHWSTPQATRLVNAATGSDDGLDIVARRIAAWMGERNKPGFVRDAAFSLDEIGQTSLAVHLPRRDRRRRTSIPASPPPSGSAPTTRFCASISR